MLRDVRTSIAFSGGSTTDVPGAGAALRLISNVPTSTYEARADVRTPLALRVVSSNRLMREGLAELLSQRTGFVVGSSAPEGLTGADRPVNGVREIIVLDHATDRDKVMRLVTDARRAMPHADVIVTGVVSRESVAELVDVGVRAFVMQGASPEELIATIGTVSADAAFPEVPPMIVVQSPRDDSRPHRSRGPREVQLTPREQQVIQLIVDGMCNKEIAAALGVAIHTVKSHVHSVLQKLSVGSRLALAALVRRQSGLREAASIPMNTTEPSGHTFRLAR